MQRLEYLGFIFDTEKETIAIPQAKWDRFKNEVETILEKDHVNTKLKFQACVEQCQTLNIFLQIR